jgi:hypothetical protein
MNPIEAKKIIDDFHKAIKDLRPEAIVQSNEDLPYGSGKIKFAHFVYGEELVKRAKITEEILQELHESYGLINSFFNEESDAINTKYREYLEGLESGIITDFRMPNPFGECESVMEYYNFLGETWFYEYRTQLLSNNLLGAFAYDGLRNTATVEKDIKTLIGLVNSAKTRKVIFPGKKTNEESVFIKKAN